jgi:chorismate synthase
MTRSDKEQLNEVGTGHCDYAENAIFALADCDKGGRRKTGCEFLSGGVAQKVLLSRQLPVGCDVRYETSLDDL